MKRLKFILVFATLTLFCGSMFSQNYQLVWSDEFTSSISSVWDYEVGGGGWGNNELEYYTDGANSFIQNGQLVIQARRENVGGREYTSSRMITYPARTWRYGRIEARIQLPSFTGSWPAFWMLGNSIREGVSWPYCGEIDIMEHVNTDPNIVGTIHWDADGTYANYGTSVPCNVTQFHVYGIEWDASGIRWFLDGAQYHIANIENGINGTSEFHAPFFIILNLAIGGNWPGFTVDNNAFPANMYVDYVRVYQVDGTPPPPPPPGNEIPGRIEAEDYASMSGIQTEPCSEGGENVGWIDAGDWMDYAVDINQSGTYAVNFRVASSPGGGVLQLRRGSTVLASVNIASTGGWQNWVTLTASANLSAGDNQTLRLYAQSGGFNVNYVDFAVGTPPPPPPPPPGNEIPGRIEAEDYASMSGIQTEPCSEGGENVGWIDAGDWMDYLVNINQSATYTVNFRVASSPGGGVLQLRRGSTTLASVNIAATGGWQNWVTLTASANLSAGDNQTLRLYAQSGGFNVNWVEFLAGTPPPPPPPPPGDAPIGSVIYLIGNNNMYVCSENGATSGMNCNRASLGSWEKYDVVDAGSGLIALRGNNARYVRGTSPMTCTATSIGTTERFTWVDLGGNQVALRGSNGQYVCSENGTAPMNCNRAAVAGWETFTWGLTTKSADIEFSDNSLNFYPNPADDELFITSDVSVHRIDIYNYTGSLVKSQVYNNLAGTLSIDVSDIAAGMYIIKVEGESFTSTEKITIR